MAMSPYARLSFFAAVALATACSGGGGSTGGSTTAGQARVSMSMVDAPLRSLQQTVTAVTITIKAVELVGQSAPVVLQTFTPSQSVNLLSIQTSPGIQL